MKTQREKIIANFYSPHKHQDLIDIYSWLSPNIQIIDKSGAPWSGVYTGLEGLGNYLAVITRFTLSELIVKETFSCGNFVFVYGRTVGRFHKTSLPFDLPIIQQITFSSEDKIERVENFSDSMALKELMETGHSNRNYLLAA